jgi:hypothetical protein
MAPPEVVGVLGECLHRGLLNLDPYFQRQNVLQLRTAVLADISKWQIAYIHSMDDERAGDAQDVGRIVWAELLILSKDSDPFPLKEMAKGRFEQGRPLHGQPYDLIFPRLAPDPDLHLIAFAKLAERPGGLAVLVRELDELQHMGGHGSVPFRAQYSARRL